MTKKQIFSQILVLFISLNSFSQSDSLSVFFAFNKTNVLYNQQVNLEQFIANINNEQYNGFMLVGYADYVGSNADNLTLSQNRVNSVYDFLISRGVEPEMVIESKGKGELPDKSNSEIGFKSNRRVDIFYHKVEVTEVVEEELEPVVEQESIIVVEPEPTVEKPVLNKGLDDIDDVGIGENLIIKNLLFKSNCAILLKRSKPVREKLLNIMQEKPKLKIEIQGHICCFPTSVTNDPVAMARAKSVYDYLKRNGINKNRISYVNFGASRKLYKYERTSFEMQANRRVEIKILDK